MAQRKDITDLTELLLKCMAEPGPMLSMLERLCTQPMEAEVSSFVGAKKDAHNPSRSDYRCGYRQAAFPAWGQHISWNTTKTGPSPEHI